MTTLAANCCVVCGKEPPRIDNAPGWTYLANAQPTGAMTCSDACLATAMDRWKRTGRVDAPGVS